MKKLFRNFTFALAAASILLTVAPVPLTTAQVPVTKTDLPTSRLALTGLKKNVIIGRDDRGIPYIEAANETDLFFAQGYVTAADRLFQMDMLRRTALGELSEIFGSATLEQDKRWRRFGFAQLAQQQYEKLSPPVKAMLDAYTLGVNVYMREHATSLPPEFGIIHYTPTPWLPADSLAASKIFADALSTSWDTDIMRAELADIPPAKRAMLLMEETPLDVLVVGKDDTEKPKIPAGDPLFQKGAAARVDLSDLNRERQLRADSLMRVGAYAEDHAASNNWVVSGKHTASGKPLLANDPHLQPSAPGIWHLVNLSAPGFHAAGVTMPGLPGIVIGHNDHIAWGMTNLGPDVQDLYAEKFDPQDPHKYLTPAGWQQAEVRTEQIKVRKSLTGTETDNVSLEVVVTRHGPIYFESKGARYALKWPALDPDTGEMAALYGLSHAPNWDQFTSALSHYGGATQNFIYADDSGNIGYYGAGHIPIRRGGDGSVPYDGATDGGEWTGYIPFAELPHVYNPPDGIIVTANQRVVGSSYRHFLTHEWAQPYRARRITDLLQGKQKLTADDFRDVQRDVFSIFLSDFVKQLIKQADAHADAPLDQGWNDTVALFRGWDGRLNAEGKASFLASQVVSAFTRKILTAALGPDRAKSFAWSNQNVLMVKLITEQPAEWLPTEYTNYFDLLRDCVKDARAGLTRQSGPDPDKWTWGAFRVADFPHPLGRIPLIGGQFLVPGFPLNGGSSTVNVGSFVSMRFIANPSNWDQTHHGLPLGESGLPSSPHWLDQLPQWRTGDTPVFPFSKKAVEAATKEMLTLTPKAP
jgi:penicillin amidase